MFYPGRNRRFIESPVAYNGIFPNVSATDFTISDDLTVSDINIPEGSNKTMGSATLVTGAATVSTTKVTANSRIFLTSQADGGTPGWLRVSARSAGTSFTVTSSNSSDTSTIAWLLVEPV